MADAQDTRAGGVQGEGDYESARRYQKEQHEFAKDVGRVQDGAKKAEEALEGPEGEELEKARRETGEGHH
jgi:hypothetical protein